MPIAASCTCGKSFRAKDELAGKKVRCPSCSAVIEIPKPAPPPAATVPASARSAEDEALAVLNSEAPVREPRSRRMIADPTLPSFINNGPAEPYGVAPPPPTTARNSPPPFAGGESTPASKPKRPVQKRPGPYSTSDSRGFFADANWGGALAGVLMMVGGAAWLGLGLLADRIFFYPVILIILGFMGAVKCVLGFESDD